VARESNPIGHVHQRPGTFRQGPVGACRGFLTMSPAVCC